MTQDSLVVKWKAFHRLGDRVVVCEEKTCYEDCLFKHVCNVRPTRRESIVFT